MRIHRHFFNLIAILALIMVSMGNTTMVAQAGNGDEVLKADPRLLQMAEENPDAVFMVIVQKAVKVKNSTETDPEADVENEGGRVKKKFKVIESFSAEMTGKQILKLAKKKNVRWISADAPMVSTAVGNPTLRDEFSSASYSNNNGTHNWAGNWIETGDGSASSSYGYVKISSGTLRFSSTNRTLSRQADLSGVASATLSFQYKRSGMDGSSDYVAIQISADGGSTWTELARCAGAGSDRSWQTASFDILSYAAADTQIRFATSSSLGSSDYLYVDNVQIEYSLPATTDTPEPAPAPSTGRPGMETVMDGFAGLGYNGNDGTTHWSNGWTEGDTYAGDADVSTEASGAFLVTNGGYCAGGSGYCLQMDPHYIDSYVYREADLSGAVRATLSLYRNNRLLQDYGAVTLEISGDGGTSWTALRTYSKDNYTSSGTDEFDVTAFAGANTQVRFRVTSSQSQYYYIYFDDVVIEYAVASAFLSSVKADQLNLNGQGVTVAVIDSGITIRNSDFNSGDQSRIIAGAYFGNQDSTKDLYGHGTHVAGIIGGNGAASAGLYRGVAPGVNLINLRVSDKDGMTYESSLLNGLEWVYNNKDAYNIRVVNISMNSTVAQSYHTSPLAAAVEILWFNGVVVVVSAGNNGTGEGPVTIYPPANDPFVITVGATEDRGTASLDDDTMAVFSAYGTTTDDFTKPDMVAPGRNLVAPLSEKASTVYNAHPLHRVGDYYFRMSGTSMSAPVVSGAVALLLQDEPNLTPDQVKYRLMATASQNWNYDPTQSGAGYLDVYAAVHGITTDSANQGILVSQMLTTGSDPITWGSVGWNSVGWNSVGWNSVGWNSVGWNSVGWNTSTWDD